MGPLKSLYPNCFIGMNFGSLACSFYLSCYISLFEYIFK